VFAIVSFLVLLHCSTCCQQKNVSQQIIIEISLNFFRQIFGLTKKDRSIRAAGRLQFLENISIDSALMMEM